MKDVWFDLQCPSLDVCVYVFKLIDFLPNLTEYLSQRSSKRCLHVVLGQKKPVTSE